MTLVKLIVLLLFILGTIIGIMNLKKDTKTPGGSGFQEIVKEASYLHRYQSYDKSPYTRHLSRVAEIAKKYWDFYGEDPKLHEALWMAAWFHDTLEPLLKEVVGVDEVKMPTKSNPFYIYEDTIDWDDDEQDVTTYEEVPYEDLVYNEEKEDYEDIGKSGRKIERIWIDDLFETGTIDHQSFGLLKCFLGKNGLSLKDFLIRKDIVVVIDGDEYCIFGQMVNAGLINMDNIEDVYGCTGGWWIK